MTMRIAQKDSILEAALVHAAQALGLAEAMREDLGDYDRVGKNLRFFEPFFVLYLLGFRADWVSGWRDTVPGEVLAVILLLGAVALGAQRRQIGLGGRE